MEDHSQRILAASLGTKFLARRVQERSSTATSFREQLSSADVRHVPRELEVIAREWESGCSRSGVGLYVLRRTTKEVIMPPSQICHNLSLAKQHAVCAASIRGEGHLRKLTLCRVPNHSFDLATV